MAGEDEAVDFFSPVAFAAANLSPELFSRVRNRIRERIAILAS